MAIKKLSQPQAMRLRRLLHMEYTPGELSRELKCPISYIRAMIGHGCPCRQDDKRRWWVVGDEFAAWYLDVVHEQKRKLKDDEVYCLRCRKAVPLAGDYKVKPLPNNLELMQALCPHCKSPVNRLRSAHGEVQHEAQA